MVEQIKPRQLVTLKVSSDEGAVGAEVIAALTKLLAEQGIPVEMVGLEEGDVHVDSEFVADFKDRVAIHLVDESSADANVPEDVLSLLTTISEKRVGECVKDVLADMAKYGLLVVREPVS